MKAVESLPKFSKIGICFGIVIDILLIFYLSAVKSGREDMA